MNSNCRIIFLLIVLTTCFVSKVSAQTDTLSLLSWNVFLRPAIMSDGQMKRVDSIAHYLVETNSDVLILQEVFHKRARKRLNGLLSKSYSFRTKIGPRSFYGVPSGVVIYSKYPFKDDAEHVSYRHATGSDKLAKKGLVHVNLICNDREVAIIGTHLQAGEGSKRTKIRQKQIELISKVEDAIDDSTTVIYAGDFNISSKAPAYDSLVTTLNAQTIQPKGKIKNTSNFSGHNLMKASGKPYWIDFIFVRMKQNAKFISSTIKSPRQIIKGSARRLSDHNPILSTLVY